MQAYCQAVAREFQPAKIVLIGSYGYGQPTADSDVDLMIIVPGSDRRRVNRMSLNIRQRFTAPFPIDILVRSSGFIASRLAERDMFIELVMTRGQVLYESQHV